MLPEKKQIAFSEEMSDLMEIKPSKQSLDAAISWMKDNLDPDDIYELDDLRKYVAGASMPQDVFEERKLEEWAENNGYIKE